MSAPPTAAALMLEPLDPLAPPPGVELAMVWDEQRGLWNRLRQGRIEALEQKVAALLERVARLEAGEATPS